MTRPDTPKIVICVVFHDDINIEYYDESLKKILLFVNVSPHNPNVQKIKDFGFQVVNQFEFENFLSLGKQYAESEVIYNIYKNPYLTADIDYIGFMQYDMHTHNLSLLELQTILSRYSYIAFDKHSVKAEYKIRYLMDTERPNTWIGRGKNCYNAILEDYNSFYNTRFNMQELMDRDINLCCTFLVQKKIFEEMMVFISSIIESRRLDAFDKHGKFRMQGGLLERYFGIWLLINSDNVFHRPIEHIFMISSNTKKTLFRHFIDYLRTFVLSH